MQPGNTRDIANILKTSQQKAFSTGLLTAALIAVLLWGSLRPTLLTIFETNERFQQKQSLLAQLQNQNAMLTNLIIEREASKANLKNIDFYFPNDGNFSLFIVNLSQIAKKFDFKMDSVTFSDTASRQIENNPVFQYAALTPVTFQVSLKGNPNNIYSFASYLEGTPFSPKIVSINYSSNRANANSTDISVNFLVYKLNQPLFDE